MSPLVSPAPADDGTRRGTVVKPAAPPRVALAAGYEIPRIVNGGWQLAADHRPGDPVPAPAALLRLAERGLTAFDCADIYTGVELLFGRMRREWIAAGRDAAALRFHTKFVPDRDALGTLAAGDVAAVVNRSRRRLGVERLDLVQFHWWDFDVPGWVDAARALAELRAAGTIRHVGVTNFDVSHLRALLDAGVGPVSNQVQYSLLDRRPGRGMAALAAERGVALLAYGTLAGGFLTARWLGQPPPAAAGNRSLTKYRLIIEEFGGWEAFQALLRVLERIAGRHGVSIANVATAWVLGRPGVAAAIVGVRGAEHVEDTLRTFDVALDDDDLARIDAALAEAPGPPGDVYSVERVPGGRHASIMKTNLNRLDDEENKT